MKRIIAGIVAGAFALGLAAPLAAQNSKDEIKKRVLKKVEEYLKREEERILKEIEKIIDEELGLTGKTPPKEKKPGFVGINIGELTAEDRTELGLAEGEGVIVTMVMEGQPAETAGVQEGDVVLSVGGKKVGKTQELIDEIKKAGAGEKVKLSILRGDEKKEIEVTLAERPDQPEEPPAPPDERMEEPKQDDESRARMRERIREFMKQERPADEPATPKTEPKTETPREDGTVDRMVTRIEEWFASSDVQKSVDQVLAKLEDMGLAVEQYLSKDEEGVWRLSERVVELLRGRLEKFAPEELEAQVLKMKEQLEKQFDLELPGFGAPAPSAGGSAFLGIMVAELDDSVRAQFDIEEGVGVAVTTVKEGSPAEQAGLKPHDVVLKIDGKWVRGESDLAKVMKRAAAGQTIELTVLTGGAERTVKAELTAKP